MAEQSRFRLSTSARGALQVWTEPQPGRDYIIGSDTAGGGPSGDFSVAVVLDAETTALVAMWRDRISPIPWARACCRLGWYYEEALLAFETGPSAHGLAACHAAIAHGYHRIYKQQNLRRADMPQGEQLGWPTNATTKPIMIARVQEAIDQGIDIPSEDVLRELSEQRYDENKKVVPEKHDDMLMALAIALCVRDRAFTAGHVRTHKPQVVLSETERFWAERDRRESSRNRMQRRIRAYA